MEHLFDFTFFESQMFWLFLCFGILVLFMYKFAVPKITKGLDSRAEQIKKDLKAAEDLKNQAEDLLAQYNKQLKNSKKEANKIMDQAQADSKIFAEEKSKELDILLTNKAKKAEMLIESSKQKAIDEIKQTTSKIVISATEKLIEETVDAKKAKQLTEKAIEELK